MKAANPRDLGDPVMEWHGVARALAALARLSDDRNVRRKYLKAARQLFGGSRIDFYHFNRGGQVRAYEINASTSNNPTYNTKMEKHVNAVWKQVQVTGALAYFGDGALANLGADTFARPRVADGLIDNTIVEFDEGGKKHMALFNHGHAYMASWWGGLVLGERESNSDGPLLINKVDFLPAAYTVVEIPEARGETALGGMLAALRAVAVQDVLKAVGGRPNDTSIREAVREWGQAYSPGYNGWGKFMYRQDSKWFDMNSASAIYPNEFPNEFREQLEDVRGEVRGSDLVAFGAYPVGYKAAEILPELRKIAVKARELVGYDASDGKGNDICTAWGYGCGGIDDVDALAVGEGDDICAPDDCGGITEVVGGSFGGRIRASIAAYIRRVDAAIAADSSLSADEIKKLHGEISGILVAFRSHVGGSLMQTRGGLQMLDYQAGQQNKGSLSLAESFRTLSEFASGIEILKGKVDALKPEESHIAARKIRYSVIHKDYDGQLITILRMKENNKASVYVAWVQGGSVHYCP